MVSWSLIRQERKLGRRVQKDLTKNLPGPVPLGRAVTLCTRCHRRINLGPGVENVVVVSMTTLDLRTGRVETTNVVTLCDDCCEIPVLTLPGLETDVRRKLSGG